MKSLKSLKSLVTSESAPRGSEAIETLKTINPKPDYQYNPDKPSTIIPDLIVEKIDGKFVVMLNDRSVPMLHINKSYANLIKGSNAKQDVKKYIREKFNSATWFIRSIEQRKTTMLKVMYAIIERQTDFLKKVHQISPLKLQDVADMVDMHISTVSRVTSNKCSDPTWDLELKYFFTEAVGRDEECRYFLNVSKTASVNWWNRKVPKNRFPIRKSRISFQRKSSVAR